MSIDIYTNDGIRNMNYREVFDISGKKKALEGLTSLTFQYNNPNTPAVFSDAWLQGAIQISKPTNFTTGSQGNFSLSAYSLFNRWQLVLDGVVVDDSQSVDANHTLMCEWLVSKEIDEFRSSGLALGKSSYEMLSFDTATTSATNASYIIPTPAGLNSKQVLFRLYLSTMFRYLKSEAFKNKVHKGFRLFEVRLFRNRLQDTFVAPNNEALAIVANSLELSLRIPEPQLSSKGELLLNRALQNLKTLRVVYEHWQHFRSTQFASGDRQPNWKVNTLTYKPKTMFVYPQYQGRVNRAADNFVLDTNPYRPDNLYIDNVIIRLNSQEYPMNGGLRRINGIADHTELYQHFLKAVGVGANNNSKKPYFDLVNFVSEYPILVLDLDYDLDEIFKLNAPVDITIQCSVSNNAGGNPTEAYHLNAVIVSDRVSDINFANGQVVSII